jgi:serpin B
VYLQDFINQFDQARLNINAWVSSETSDKINNLLPPDSLDAMTRMVLVNAIHLKLPWDQAFAAYVTAPNTFTRADGTAVSTSFMNQTLTVPYVDDGQAQIVGLPLAGREVSVVIALPHPGQDLATYEAGLTTKSAALAQPASTAFVELTVPKAIFTSPTFSLASALQAMGMSQAFDPNGADFSGMCAHAPDGLNLYISDVLQKAMIAMEETGVEAAAATAVIESGSSGGGPVPTTTRMDVNRPYLIAIVDVPTGAILFLGHIEDPTDQGGP